MNVIPIHEQSNFSKTPLFKSESPFSPIEKVTARLAAFGSNDEIFVSGSCVRIAKNLYLTARHVMTDYLDRFGHDGGEAKFTVWATHINPGPEYSIWQMDRFWLSPHSDLAVFHTMPYNDTAGAEKNSPLVGIDLMPPAVGSRIVGFGHHSSTGRIRLDEKGVKHIEVNTDGTTTVGEIREIHFERRDSVRLTFPCFRVNARFDGGMSGGPIFTDSGRLCGIICSSLPAHNEKEEHSSYAATLWPLMGLTLDVNPSPYRVLEKPYPFIELVRKGIIQVNNLSKVLVQPSATTGLYNVAFQKS